MKAGFFTTEFWMSVVGVVMSALIAVLHILPSIGDALPGVWGKLVGAFFSVISVPIIGWITTHYTGGRVDLKKMAMASAAAAPPGTGLNR